MTGKNLICIIEFEYYMVRVMISCGRAPASVHLAKLFHLAGHEVYIIDANRFHFGRYRSWVKKTVKHPPPKQKPNEFKEWLIDFVNQEKIDIIIPVYEETFHFAKNMNSLDCEVFTTDITKLDLLHNKYTFIETCEELGLTFPKTKLINSVEQLEDSGISDYIVKPVYSRFGHNVQFNPSKKSFRGKINDKNPWIIQEKIEGKQHCLQGICYKGQVLSVSSYNSEFSISKSSVYFKNSQRGDLGEIISKIASRLEYTGFICFDVIETVDGELYPIECNPRATSALHLYSTEDELPDCILNKSTTNASGVPRRITVPMYMNLIRNMFKKSHYKNWRKAMKNSKSTELDRFSPRISVLKYLVLLNFISVALRNRISIISATSYEYEWNSEEKRVNL